MRELKFRAWDKINHRIREVIEISFTQQYIWTKTDTTPYTLSSQQYELMQYTGLKDKNGKEIYEGDIVTVETYHSSLGAWQIEYRLPVKYLGDRFCATNGRVVEALNFLPNHIEVIGNIYEHSYLFDTKTEK